MATPANDPAAAHARRALRALDGTDPDHDMPLDHNQAPIIAATYALLSVGERLMRVTDVLERIADRDR